MTGLALVTDALTLRFGSQLVLDIADFAAGPGTLTVLSGASGSGKSSLLYLLSGLARPSSGTVRWGDVDLAALPEAARDRWRRQHAGFVFQDFNLVEEMTPLDNVLLPAWFARLSAAPMRQRAEALLARLAVPRDRRRAGLLSRGEQQRVALARALLGDPPVIFADEPTASLDTGAGKQVIDILAGLAGEGPTVIVASHDPALRAVASAKVTLEHGRRIAT